jgi:hypothetical protein
MMTGLELHQHLFDQLSRRGAEGRVYRRLLEEILGFPVENVLISTAEHTAPFNRAHTVSFLLPQLILQQAGLKPRAPILILAASLIPLDNEHYPRGFLLPQGRFNLFPCRQRKKSPALLPPAKALEKTGAPAFFSRYPWLRRVFQEERSHTSYARQISGCMEGMAQQWFPEAPPGNVRVRPLEEVARQMLIRLLEADDALLGQLLFDNRIRGLVARDLLGIFCAWGQTQGSFYFWGAQDAGVARLREENGHLLGASWRIPLEKDSLLDFLRAGRLWPGVFLSLLMVSFFPNLPISGGPKQLHYYRLMIWAANRLDCAPREERLAGYGYMILDFTGMRLGRENGGLLPSCAPGLALADAQLDPDWLAAELSRLPLLPFPEVIPGLR